MSSAPTTLLGRSTVSSAARVESLGLYRAALWVLLAANLLVGWGVRKNRSTPGGPVGGNFGRLLAFAPVVLLALDPRRRPVAATLVYAVGLFAVWGVTISRTPAFQPMVPASGPTAAVLLITLAMALGGAAAAHWLANSLTRTARAPAEGNAR